MYLVRHSRSANCGLGSTPAATAKDTERARVCAHRYGYPHRNTERNSGAEQRFCDHQMPSHWSRCMLRFQCSLRRASRSSCHLSHRSMNLSSILSIAITSISPLAIAALASQLNGSTTNITSASGENCAVPRTAWRNRRVRAVLSAAPTRGSALGLGGRSRVRCDSCPHRCPPAGPGRPCQRYTALPATCYLLPATLAATCNSRPVVPTTAAIRHAPSANRESAGIVTPKREFQIA